MYVSRINSTRIELHDTEIGARLTVMSDCMENIYKFVAFDHIHHGKIQTIPERNVVGGGKGERKEFIWISRFITYDQFTHLPSLCLLATCSVAYHSVYAYTRNSIKPLKTAA